LQFELERDRLAMELEEERRLRETLEHRLAEQQQMLENHDDTGLSAKQFTDSIQVCLAKQQHGKFLLPFVP
jgi:centromeric protein E